MQGKGRKRCLSQRDPAIFPESMSFYHIYLPVATKPVIPSVLMPEYVVICIQYYLTDLQYHNEWCKSKGELGCWLDLICKQYA